MNGQKGARARRGGEKSALGVPIGREWAPGADGHRMLRRRCDRAGREREGFTRGETSEEKPPRRQGGLKQR